MTYIVSGGALNSTQTKPNFSFSRLISCVQLLTVKSAQRFQGFCFQTSLFCNLVRRVGLQYSKCSTLYNNCVHVSVIVLKCKLHAATKNELVSLCRCRSSWCYCVDCRLPQRCVKSWRRTAVNTKRLTLLNIDIVLVLTFTEIM